MVDVYYGNIHLVEKPEVFQQFLEKMNTKRRSKILRCKNEKDRCCSLLAGILLKHGLELRGLDYDRLVFSENGHGKPFLENPKDIHFSISHSGDYVVCAISGKNVGVDIENSRRMLLQKEQGALKKVAKRCFSKEEYAFYESSTEKQELFLKFWTRKESFSKAAGMGLGMDFSQIDVMSEKTEDRYWSGWLAEGYYLSVYLENGQRENVVLREVK